MVGIESDFSDVGNFFQDGEKEVLATMESVGKESVEYAKENGNYQNRTGNLRKSSRYEADESGLTLENDMEYASYVESKGYDVLGNAALHAEKRLKEELE